MPIKTHELHTLPRHDFYGDTFPERFMESVRKYIIEPPLEDLPPEVPLSPEMEQTITKTFEALGLFAREELGVDISSRLPERKDIHILSRGDFKAYYKSLYPDSDDELLESVEGFHLWGQIVVPFDEDAVLSHTITHEGVHAISNEKWKLELRSIGEEGGVTFRETHTRSGYKSLVERHRRVGSGHKSAKRRKYTDDKRTGEPPFWAIEEWLTEEIARKVAKDYYPRVGLGGRSSTSVYAYTQLVPVMERVKNQISSLSQGLNENELLKELERGMLMGDMKALRPLMMELDSDLAREMTHMKPYGEQVEAFARNLGKITIGHVQD